MKIGYFADGPWAHQAFRLLIQDPSIEFKFIVPRVDTTDFTLLGMAKSHNIDYLHPVKINSSDFIEKVKNYTCDLHVSMSFNQIFKKELIELPPLKTINCHAGLLPFYRGRNILNWALINDEHEFGITVHFIDEGIDTGDIILQRKFPITDSDTYHSLLETAYIECASILYDAIKQLQNGTATSIPQSNLHPTGFYCGRRTLGDEIINWNSSSRQVFNFIRAICLPGPMATTSFKGQQVKINHARYFKNAPTYINTPGQLLKKTKEGFIIKTLDSFIEIIEIESNIKLRVGDKLGI